MEILHNQSWPWHCVLQETLFDVVWNIFCNHYAKETSSFKTATFSLWFYNGNIFSWRLFGFYNNTPPLPTLLRHLLSWKPWLWVETTERWKKTATDLCHSGWRQPWSVRPRHAWWMGGPLAPVATHPSPPQRPGWSAPHWGWTVPEEDNRGSRTRQHQWCLHIRLS